MPNNVYVALWSNNNHATQSWSQSINERVRRLDTMLHLTEQAMKSVSADLNVNLPYKGIFLAPEYYFTRKHPHNVRAAMRDDRRLTLEQQLQGLSQKYPQILIVPGTVFYHKRWKRPKVDTLKFDPRTGLRTLPKTSDRDRRERWIGQLDSYVGQVPPKRDANDRDFVSWQHTGYSAGGKNVPSLNRMKAEFEDEDGDVYAAKNATYFFLDGKRLAKFDKQTDYGEAMGAPPDDLSFVPAVFKQCPDLNGYRFGAEICFDHANGMLARRRITPLHFHIVVSDWAVTSTGNMAMTNGGYYAHASTNYGQSSIYMRNNMGAVENITINPTYHKHTGGHPSSEFDGYVLPFPAPIMPARK